MWRYLILNTLWFSILFLVNFYGTRKSRFFMSFFILVTAAVTAAQPFVDPITWIFYTLFSYLVLWSAARFKIWVFARLDALNEEFVALSKRVTDDKRMLASRAAEVDAMSHRADEISHLYDKVKEMSRSLDRLETFLIYAEAMLENFQFESIKLVLFDHEDSPGWHPGDAFQVRAADFQARVFDRGSRLKDPKKSLTKVTAFDTKLCEAVFASRKPLVASSARDVTDDDSDAPGPWPLLAQPVFIQERIFAVLLVFGVRLKDLPLLSILTEQFISEVQRVKLYERVQTLALTDGLTGVAVRRHLIERFGVEMDRSLRFDLKLSFLMVDIDHFKHFNDDYGHLVGDVVLRQVAETIRKNIREVDLVGRFGGEEFAALLVETDESAAYLVAERIRRSVAEREFKAYGENLKVTVSVGCATSSQDLNEPEALLEAADAALYQAKRQGRNRVCLAALPETD